MQKQRGQLGDVVEDERVLPDDHSVGEAAQRQGVVGLVPGEAVGAQVELEETGEVDKVTEVQHEELTSLTGILKVSEIFRLTFPLLYSRSE